MKKFLVVIALVSTIMLTGCGELKYSTDELISAKSNSVVREGGGFFLVWATYSKDKEMYYNFYHKSSDGKIQLSCAEVHSVEIYEDVPNDKNEYVMYTNRYYEGILVDTQFHVHKGSIQPVIDIDVNKR